MISLKHVSLTRKTLMLIFAVLLVATSAQAAWITGVSATASNAEGPFPVERLLDGGDNGSGPPWDGGFDPILGTQTADDDEDDMNGEWAEWRTGDVGSAAAVANHWVKFDLGALYDLGSVHIWNLNRKTLVNGVPLTLNGVETMFLRVSADDVTYENLGLITLTQGPGVDGLLGESFATSPTGQVRHVEFDIETSFGEADDAGWQASLSEVRFSPIPEPSTLVLAAVGLLGVLGFNRRRRK